MDWTLIAGIVLVFLGAFVVPKVFVSWRQWEVAEPKPKAYKGWVHRQTFRVAFLMVGMIGVSSIIVGVLITMRQIGA